MRFYKEWNTTPPWPAWDTIQEEHDKPQKVNAMNTKEAAETLDLYITTSDKKTLDAFDFAFRHASRAVDSAARTLAKVRADWHDDPEGDPEGHAEHHAPAAVQFDTDARAAVVVALFERCERIRQENILNVREVD